MFKKILMSMSIMTVTAAAMAVSTYAAFTAQATISGVNFSTGNAALNIFGNLGYTNAGNNGNLTYNLPGPGISGVQPFWNYDYRIKYFNNGSVKLNTSLTLTVNSDTSNLAEYMFVETWLWGDTNGNGIVDGTDTLDLLAPEQTFASLQSNPVQLGQLNPGNPRGLLLKFSTDDLPGVTQNQNASYNFVIQGTTDGVTP